MKNYISFLVIVTIIFFSGIVLSTRAQNQPELIFQSGFERDSRVISRGSDADIVGVDNSVNMKNDWGNDLDNFNIQYQGGNSTQRYAKIIQEPGKPENHVLQFWLNEPNVGGKKGRIQANLYGGEGLKEFYQSERVFLHDDFNTVRTFPDEIHWLTIAEFWNNITWSQNVPNRYRLTLGIGKPVKEESDLHFIVDGQDCELFEDNSQKYTTLWSEINKEVAVPIGKWFTLEYYYKEGDAKNGRFYMSIQPEGEEKKVIFDIARATQNSNDLTPDGVTDFNPLKLYTSKKLIDYMNSKNKTLQIYWDDFNLWKNKKPQTEK